MEQEIWKDVEGFGGDYIVSNFGKVKSLRFNKRILLKQCKNSSGYYVVGLSKNKIRKIITVHRLVAEAFIENKYNKLTVNHKNGIKSNNHTSNLEWATNAENIQHAYNTGLMENARKAVKKNAIIATEARKMPVFSSKLNMQFESIRSASIYVKEHYFNNSTVDSISTTINDLIAGRKQTSKYDYGWEYIDKINNMEQEL